MTARFITAFTSTVKLCYTFLSSNFPEHNDTNPRISQKNAYSKVLANVSQRHITCKCKQNESETCMFHLCSNTFVQPQHQRNRKNLSLKAISKKGLYKLQILPTRIRFKLGLEPNDAGSKTIKITQQY